MLPNVILRSEATKILVFLMLNEILRSAQDDVKHKIFTKHLIAIK